MHDIDKKSRRPSLFGRALNQIEGLGNRLPDPIFLFVWMCAATAIGSWIVASMGASVVHPVTGKTIYAVNLLTPENLRRMLVEAVPNFLQFPPLGVVLVIMLGVGVAEKSGWIEGLIRGFVLSVPRGWMTAGIVFAGVCSSVAADAGFVVLIPLGGAIFASVGRHPLAGMFAAFAGVSGAFEANVFPAPIDAILAGLTQAAARLYETGYVVNPLCNYYFMAISAVALTATGWWVTEKIIEPRLGQWEPEEGVSAPETLREPEPRERKANRWALACLGLFTIVVAALVVPPDAFLRDQKGGVKPFFDAFPIILAAGFLIPGIIYGKLTGSLPNGRAVRVAITESIGSMSGFMVLAFVAAQFISYFSWSNLGVMLALSGAEKLHSVGATGISLVIGIVLMSTVLNLFITSASAMWAAVAAVFAPMFMHLGLSPELTQAAFRIGESVTNCCTPLMSYFPLILIFAQRWVPRVGIGTILSSMLPYSVLFTVVWTSLLIVWYLVGLPLGPGGSLFFSR
ncbi:MAG TPA: AbgT family transporter [Chthoniobacterales bacterium]